MPLGNEEQQQPHMKVPVAEAPQGLKELVNQFFLKTMKFMLVKKFKWRVIPPHLKKAMRSVYSSKLQEAMKVKMNSMNTNVVCDLEEIPNEAKTVGCKWVYKIKCDSKGDVERYKA